MRSVIRGIALTLALIVAGPATTRADLPDGRVYEQVSPAEKNGGDILADSGRTRASADGDAAGFTSFAGFADVQGTSITTEYFARRSADGWVTHGITPMQEPLSALQLGAGQDPVYEGEFSPDFSKGVLRSASPLTEGGANVKTVQNLYVRDDLGAPGPGSYELLTDAVAPVLDPFGRPFFVGASDDFGHIVFEVARNLTANAPPQPVFCALLGFGCEPRLYEWDHGTVRLTGILPDESAAPASSAPLEASHYNYDVNTVSTDGERVLFRAPPGNREDPGQLYMRIEGTTTVRINESEASSPDPVPGSATFQAATPDVKHVFFTSGEHLVDGPGGGLYRYDVDAPAKHHLTTISVDREQGDPGGVATGVLGVSDDGSTVYFMDSSQLVPGGPGLQGTPYAVGIYRWRDDVTTYIGHFSASYGGEDQDQGLGAGWVLSYRTARVSADGSTLLFSSHLGEGLAGYEHGTNCGAFGHEPCIEYYVFDGEANGGAGRLECASCAPNRNPATRDAMTQVRTGTSGSNTSSHLAHSLSADGRRVFFSTGEALVPEDRNGKVDAYEFDVSSGAVHLISTGHSTSDSYFMDASASGNDVFFLTREQLVSTDTDNNLDLYDARVGGSPDMPPPVLAACSGAGCQGPVDSPPDAPTPASMLTAAPGNLSTPGVPKRVVKRSSNAQKLGRALKVCKNKPKSARKRCESQARKRLGKRSSNQNGGK